MYAQRTSAEGDANPQSAIQNVPIMQFRLARLQVPDGAAATNVFEQQSAEPAEGLMRPPPPPSSEDLARAALLCDRLVHETEGLVLEALEVSPICH